MARLSLMIYLHRALQPMVDWLHIRSVAQRVFRSLYQWRHPMGSLVPTISNGRELWIDANIALGNESSEPATVKWLRQHLSVGQCAFDIGANIGEMTLEMACLVGSGGRVVAIEPAPGNLRILRSHVEKNGFSSFVDIVSAVAGDGSQANGRLVILGNSEDTVGTGHNILPDQRQHPHHVAIANASVNVPFIVIDQYCTDYALHPSVLKIDVEGGELAVLRGCERTLHEDGPAVYFAFHPWAFDNLDQASREIRGLFADASYTLDADDTSRPLEFREYSAVSSSGRLTI